MNAGPIRLGLTQAPRLEQRLVQSPQLIQAMQILQLPLLDLQGRIEQELLENPFLEVAEPVREDGEGAPQPQREATHHHSSEKAPISQELDRRAIDTLEAFERLAGEHIPRRPRSSPEGDERRQEALNNATQEAKSLAEVFESQLGLLELDEKEMLIAHYILASVDPRGYLRIAPEEIASDPDLGATTDDVLRVLEKMRALGPPGLFAHDLRECLLLQLGALFQTSAADTLEYALVDKHLEDIAMNRLPKIQRELGRDMNEIKDAIATIRKLNPNPAGGEFSERNVRIVPDVIVSEVDGNYDVRLERGSVPELRISNDIAKLLSQAKQDPKVHEFLERKFQSAKWFKEAIERRRLTLEKICRAIFERQRDFLEKGSGALRPLRMQEIADEVGVHISTVSRAISGKYVDTPRGIFPLKFFFVGGTVTEDGEYESQTAIKELVKSIIEMEDKQNPLSDEEIGKKLSEKNGVPIARRTITKYRKALNIPASSQRKVY
jgi:RNA polymerase sigma-54 factor